MCKLYTRRVLDFYLVLGDQILYVILQGKEKVSDR